MSEHSQRSADSASSSAMRPIVLRFGALGDMILLTSLLRALRRVWGQPCDVVVPGGGAGAVFSGLDSVGEMTIVESRRAPYWLSRDQRRLVAYLRRRRGSPIYVADRPDRCEKDDWLLEKAGVPRSYVVGPREVGRGDLEHVVHYFGRMAGVCPSGLTHLPRNAPSAEAPPPELCLRDEEIRECVRWLESKGWTGEPLIFMQTQSRRLKRGRWATANWEMAVRHVLETLPGGLVLLLGSLQERELVEEVRAACAHPVSPSRVWNVAGEVPLRRLFALLSLCHSGISLDSGPAHAAAAVRCPVVVLTGQADPRRNLPVGPPERVQGVTAAPPEQWPRTRVEWEAWHQLSEIPVDAVLAAWGRLEPREERADSALESSPLGYGDESSIGRQ